VTTNDALGLKPGDRVEWCEFQATVIDRVGASIELAWDGAEPKRHTRERASDMVDFEQVIEVLR